MTQDTDSEQVCKKGYQMETDQAKKHERVATEDQESRSRWDLFVKGQEDCKLPRTGKETQSYNLVAFQTKPTMKTKDPFI